MRLYNKWISWNVVRPLKKTFRSIFILPARRFVYRNIPIAMITGTNGKTTTTRMLAHILKHHGCTVGYISTEGAYVGEKLAIEGDCSGYSWAGKILKNDSITAAVLETARGGIVKQGLYVDRCDAAALLNIANEQVGIDGINSLRDMLGVKRKVTDAARTKVLNAEDPLCAELLDEYAPDRTIAFALNGITPTIEKHLKRGGSAIFRQSDDVPKICFATPGGHVDTIASVTELPATYGGIVQHNIANAMAAAALASGMDVPWATIREALMTFENSIECSANRFNMIEGYDFTLIVDDGINAPALATLMKSVTAIPVEGSRRFMITVCGDRPDSVFTDVAKAVEGHFDHVVCFDIGRYRSYRPIGEIPERLKAAFENLGTPPQRVDAVIDVEDGLKILSDAAESGDLLLLQQVDIKKSLPVIRDLFSPHERADNTAFSKVH